MQPKHSALCRYDKLSNMFKRYFFAQVADQPREGMALGTLCVPHTITKQTTFGYLVSKSSPI